MERYILEELTSNEMLELIKKGKVFHIDVIDPSEGDLDKYNKILEGICIKD